MTTNLLLLLGSYLLGSIPTAYIIMKALTGQDLHHLGSGNIGATNLTKHIGKKWGAVAFIIDASKGALALLLSQLLGATIPWQVACAFTAVLGHNFPLWLHFKGGKGVSTSLGLILVLSRPLFVALLALWFVVFKSFGYVSVASLTALWAAPILFALVKAWPAVILTGLLALLSTYQHRSNLQRLKAGTETNYKRNRHE